MALVYGHKVINGIVFKRVWRMFLVIGLRPAVFDCVFSIFKIPVKSLVIGNDAQGSGLWSSLCLKEIADAYERIVLYLRPASCK